MPFSANLTEVQRQTRIALLVPTSLDLTLLWAGYADRPGDLQDHLTMRDAIEFERGLALNLMNVTLGENKYDAAVKYGNLTKKLDTIEAEIKLARGSASCDTPTSTLPSAYARTLLNKQNEFG